MYYALINVGYPGERFECRGQSANEAEARQIIEKELTDLFGDTWERLNDIQYGKKDHLADSIFILALLDIQYSPEEQERQELDSLPRQIAALQERLAELQTKYPPADYRVARGVLADVADEPAEASIRRQRDAGQAKLTKAQLRELDDLNVLGELTYNRKNLPVSFKMMQSLYEEGLVDLVGSDENTATYKINEAGRTALDGAL
jgi:hypothetical protein